jgi:hypothetical protein
MSVGHRDGSAMTATKCDGVDMGVVRYRRGRGISQGIDDDRRVSPDIYPPFKTRGDSTRVERQEEDLSARD